MTDAGELIFWTVQWVLLGAILILFLPLRRKSRIVTTRILKTTPQGAWDALVDFPEFGPDTEPRHPILSKTVVSYRKVSDDPTIFESILDASKGQRTSLLTMRSRVITHRAPWHTAANIEDLNGTKFPFGEDALAEYQFEDFNGATRATHIFTLRTRSLFHDLTTRWSGAQFLNRAAEYFEHGTVTDKPQALLSWQRNLALTALTFGSFALAFGWQFGIGLSMLLLLHEFGHWATMRLRGYSTAKMTLLPFLGGVASPNQPYRSQFDAALCTLMGPGLSAIVCGLMILAAMALDGPAVPSHTVLDFASVDRHPLAELLSSTAAFIGIFNLFQLLPVVPLDGGQILRQVLPAGKYDVSRYSVIAIAIATCVAAVRLQQYIFVPMALIGLAMFGRANPAILAQIPMQWRGRLAIITGTLAALLVLAASCADMLGHIAGIGDPWRRMAYASGLRPTLPGAKGTRDIEPKFTVRLPLLDGLNSRTWVSGGDWRFDRREWRTWGSIRASGPDVEISVLDTSGQTGRSESLDALKKAVSNRFAEDDVTIVFAAAGARVATQRGPADTMAFTLTADDMTKSCQAFHAYLASGRTYVWGHACAASTGAASDQAVVCLIDALALPGSTAATPAAKTGCLADLDRAGPDTPATGTRAP